MEKIEIKEDLEPFFKKMMEKIKEGKRIFIFAGPSSSGKSYLTKKLKEFLENKKKKVLLIPLDNFYKKNTLVYSVIYGSFDHIRLFDIKYLNKCLNSLFKNGYCYLPIYSFEEKNRIGYKKIEADKDTIILIEGLYPFKIISKQILNRKDTFKVFITADEEELLFRRIIRDPERTKEPLYLVIEHLTSVFPFWNVFGENQKNIADLVVLNNFPMLNKFKKPKKELNKKEFLNLLKNYKFSYYITYNYIYRNKKVIKIKEYYKRNSDILDHYSLVVEDKNGFYEVPMRFLGKISSLHMLLQNLGFEPYKIVKTATLILKEEEKPVYEIEIINGKEKRFYLKEI